MIFQAENDNKNKYKIKWPQGVVRGDREDSRTKERKKRNKW